VAPPWTLPATVLTGQADFGPWHPPVWTLLTAPVASMLGLLEPVIATTTAWAFLGETLAWVQVLGTAVLLTGALIVQLNSPKPQVGVGEPGPASGSGSPESLCA
jgi:hypothetical protein